MEPQAEPFGARSAGAGPLTLEVEHRLRGRALLVEADGALHVGHNYEVFRSRDDGASWTRVATLPRSPLRRAAELSRLACRLLRHEVRALARLDGDRYVASNREGVFHGDAGEPVMRRCEVDAGDLPLRPPMRITVGPGGVVLFGEYGSGPRRPMRVFASRDGGRRFEVVHTLPRGEVLHIHNIVYDPALDHYWVLTGDFDPEPGIGRLSSDLTRFDWFVKGEQRFRAVEVFDLGDRLLYATDTHLEGNGLISLDKRTGKTERLRDFEGSCIYACRFGGIYALTTTVEPSDVNRGRTAGLWLSRDGERWERAWQADKDRWNADYFQFGSIVLPSGQSDRESVCFSGQAVQGIDGETVVARVAGG